MSKDEVVVLFSGGTDSTLTAALMAEKHKTVHLITYKRFGFFSVTNPKINVEKLQDKFKNNNFIHQIVKLDKLTKYVFYERYLRNLIKFRFFLLSICGLCKLAMHIRTVIFCLENKVSNVCDGANKGMDIFPAQMENVLKEIKNMYSKFGINYINPVFEFEGPQDTEFTDRLHFEKILNNEKKKDKEYIERKKRTTGYKLFKMGLMPSENVKGTKLDRKMQPRCFQFILSNIFVLWYYLSTHEYEEYKQVTLRFYKDKISFFSKLLEEYVNNKEKSKIFKFLE